MLSPKRHEFDQSSKAKVPFAWELKPGVSKRHNKTTDQLQWKLTPPPCPYHVDYTEEVLQSPLVVCPFTPSNTKTPRSHLTSFRKRDVDPFLEAYRKCLENSPIRFSNSLRRSIRDQDCYTKGKKKSFLLWLWSKYSCKVGTDGWSALSRFRKPKSSKRIDSTK